ncbi:MAG: hypothetical protein PHP89_06680, partial [Candidatus Omnitrophica bacterium]|nr:hypothetical protein [Candidatus Omnitrophota bacterium]
TFTRLVNLDPGLLSAKVAYLSSLKEKGVLATRNNNIPLSLLTYSLETLKRRAAWLQNYGLKLNTATIRFASEAAVAVYAQRKQTGFISITDKERAYETLAGHEVVGVGLVRNDKIFHNRSIAIPATSGLSEEALDELADYLSIEIISTLSRLGAEGLILNVNDSLYGRIKKLLTESRYNRVPGYYSGIYETRFTISQDKSAAGIQGDGTVELAQEQDIDYRVGRVVGLDVGASDVKVIALINGRCIFAKEINWKSVFFASSKEHVRYFSVMARLAKVAIEIEESKAADKSALQEELKLLAHNPNTPLETLEAFIDKVEKAGVPCVELDAVGLSTAGAITNGRLTQEGARVYKSVQADEFWTQVAPLAKRLSIDLGGVPVGIINDGDAGALSVAVTLGLKKVLALSLGTGLAAGYVDGKGQVTNYLGEMGKCSIDLAANAEQHEGLRIRGALQQYTSQRGVLRLSRGIWLNFDRDFEEKVAREFAQQDGIDLAGVENIVDFVKPKLTSTRGKEFEKATGDRPKLKFVQSLLDLEEGSKDRALAERIFKTIGYYLAVATSASLPDLDIAYVVLFGACTSGRAGELIISSASEHLIEELGFEKASHIHIVLASEEDYAKNVGTEISAEFDEEFAARFGQAVGAAYMGMQMAKGMHPEAGKALTDEAIASRFSGTPEYGIHLQRSRLEKALADAKTYHDAVVILVKRESLAATRRVLEGAYGKVIPVNSQIVEIDDNSPDSIVADVMRERRENGTVAIILAVVGDDVPGNLSAILRSLLKLSNGGVDFTNERLVMILSGGDGKRNYPLTPADGYGNKGLVCSLNGEPNLFQALRQSLQLMGEGDAGIVTMSVDRIFGITEPIEGLGRYGIQLLGGKLEKTHPEWDYYGKLETDSDGRLLVMHKRKSEAEAAYLQKNADEKYFPVNNLTVYYFRADAIAALIKSNGDAATPNINNKDQDINQVLGKNPHGLAQTTGIILGFVNTGVNTYITDLGSNDRYYTGYQNLLTDDILRQLVGLSFMTPKSLIGNEVTLGKDVIVENGAVILGKVNIKRGIIRKGAVIINSTMDEIDAAGGSLVVAVYRPGQKVIAETGKAATDVPLLVNDQKHNISVSVDVNVDPKASWTEKQFDGFSYKDMKDYLDYAEVSIRKDNPAVSDLKPFGAVVTGGASSYKELEFDETLKVEVDLKKDAGSRVKSNSRNSDSVKLAELV